ncbi:MFS general substrate transporter [Schizophyllum commune H4-8]|uniref:MFS general substrate transporter n=1 Tax=Schizophyllum commune (strain H4-8 / FGSC 9210) TaxID=578458 RepID=UPI00215FC3E1|nr:MFS general substrate transporter [Schizophyllum commune H4-8]KAI5894417.1 MFS general substrate transporter [Schizophyllum commune H4-8]
MPVANDPRQWSVARKNFSLFLISSGAMIAGLAANIQNPAVAEMERSLPATSGEISLSISLFILIQGFAPIMWSSISEVKGRKVVYIVSIAIFTVGSIIVAISNSIGLVIGFRCMQAVGSSAVIAIGAATLADIFEPAERGTKMGVYYMAPLLGPSVASVLGGVLTSGFNWRGPFWFLAIVSGCSLLGFIVFFKDTFRKERSLTYQNILKSRLREAAKEGRRRRRAREKAVGREGKREKHDAERGSGVAVIADGGAVVAALPDVKVTLRDVNPFPGVISILRRPNNVVMLFSSGLLFSYSFIVPYTSSRTLSTYYGYTPLEIGFVLLSFGVGSLAGSLLGGRWSDMILRRLRARNGGKFYPEMRLQSTIPGLISFPIFVLGFAWITEEHVHISGMCVMLFMTGLTQLFVYASTLSYVVDANVGRSSYAVALNSAFRGISAFVATEIAVPLQDGLGDGWLYTLWAALMACSSAMVVLIIYKGAAWRAASEASEQRRAAREAAKYGETTPAPTAPTSTAVTRPASPVQTPVATRPATPVGTRPL